MDKLKKLLLPLALIFGAIAVFDTGGRYGAINMRAHAIASELQLPLSIYIAGQSTMDAQAKAQWTAIIDHGIAAGAIHRQLWYLNEEAKGQLDKALTFALSARGDGTAKRYELIANSEEKPSGLSDTKLHKIQSAINRAIVELIDNARKDDGVDQVNDSADG
tara:strand:+ start:13146 stop:13631 length:486 start_codon:yes stop_codon:yes gene_type:complete